MIYEIQSKNDMSAGACLVIRFPEKDLDKKALYTIEADRPEFLVPFRHRSIDGQIECTYLLGDRSKLKYRFGRKTAAEYVRFWTDLLQPLLDCEDWFLKPSSFALEAEDIYISRDEKTVSYIYVPTVNDCVGPDAMRDMARQIAELNPVDDIDMENRVLRAIMQGFRPGEFLKMLGADAESGRATGAVRKVPSPIPERPVMAVDRPPETPREEIPGKTPKPLPKPEQSASADIPEGDELIIDFDAKKRGKQKEKVREPKKKHERPQKPEKPQKEPKHGLFGGKKEHNAIMAGAANPQDGPVPAQEARTEYTPIDLYPSGTQEGETTLDEGVRLRLISGSPLPKVIDVNIGPSGIFTIGRFDVSVGVKQSDFEFDRKTMSVSRHHAAIEREQDGTYTIVDLNSKAGTYMDGTKLTPNIPYRLARGSRVSFGISGADYIWEE